MVPFYMRSCFEDQSLKLLTDSNETDELYKSGKYSAEEQVMHVEHDNLMQELSNIKRGFGQSGQIVYSRIVKSAKRDRATSLMYGLSVVFEYEKEGKTMRKLEAMAGELDMALWIPTQGTKESVNLELVTMDKAGGSFKKIQIGHIIMSIARTMDDIAKCLATIAILKNRAGSAGKVFNKVEFNNGTCRISTDNVDEYDSMSEFNHNRTENQTKEINAIAKKILDNKKA